MSERVRSGWVARRRVIRAVWRDSPPNSGVFFGRRGAASRSRRADRDIAPSRSKKLAGSGAPSRARAGISRHRATIANSRRPIATPSQTIPTPSHRDAAELPADQPA
jgi:hypothetical protein